MDPNTLEVLKVVLTDTVKILGPASIAAYFTYKATKSQYEFRVREIERNQEFGAKEHLFDYYRDRQVRLEKRNQEATEGCTQLVVQVSAAKDEDDIDRVVLDVAESLLESGLRSSPLEFQRAKRDMERHGLAGSEGYLILEQHEEEISRLEVTRNPPDLAKALLKLIEAWSHAEYCNDDVLESRIEAIFVSHSDRQGDRVTP